MQKTPSTKDPLLWRFSMYGFLKNQQYYEPFFILVLLSKGLNFFEIGVLYSFREACVLIMGVPAGFAADLYGRRSSILLSFVAYIVSFIGFAFVQNYPMLFAVMFAFAIGESFRSGTHKAMIFQHLKITGQESQKVRVYGFTRSWSKIGSAISNLASGLLVFFSGSYGRIFLFTIPPYLINLFNVGTYPAVLEGEHKNSLQKISISEAFKTMIRETIVVLKNKDLRRIFVESAALQATSKTVKDYVQPLVVVALAGTSILVPFGEINAIQKSALTLAILYFTLNSFAAIASRNAHRFSHFDQYKFPILWAICAVLGGLIFVGSTYKGATIIAVIGFILLVLLENLWRPIFLDRLDHASDNQYGAAVLSVEAQFQSMAIMVLAPAVGWIVDRFGLASVGIIIIILAVFTALYRFLHAKSPALPLND